MALLTALMAALLLMAIGAGLTLTTVTESAIAANHRDGTQTLYAAEAGIELAISRLRTTADWPAVATSDGRASFVHGRLVDLVQSTAVDPRINVIVSVSADPSGDPDVIVLQASASGPGGLRRNVQVIVRRLPADAHGSRDIETLSWR
jgi:Tfp pilus assembly protein PilX